MAFGARWSGKSLDAIPAQRKKTASERRAQRLRAEGRRLQHVLCALNEVHVHRGGQLSKFGNVLREVLLNLHAPSSQRGVNKQDVLAVNILGSDVSESGDDTIAKPHDLVQNLHGPIDVRAGDVLPPPAGAALVGDVYVSGSANSSQAFVPCAHHSPRLYGDNELSVCSNEGSASSGMFDSDEDFGSGPLHGITHADLGAPPDHSGDNGASRLSSSSVEGLAHHMHSLGYSDDPDVCFNGTETDPLILSRRGNALPTEEAMSQLDRFLPTDVRCDAASSSDDAPGNPTTESKLQDDTGGIKHYRNLFSSQAFVPTAHIPGLYSEGTLPY